MLPACNSRALPARKKLASAAPPDIYGADAGTYDFRPDPGLWLYRDRTVALLRRYSRLAVELGRLPSLLGREFFRSRVTSYRTATFEDTVIFVYDIERSIERLDEFDQRLIAALAIQDYTGDEAARLLRCNRRTVVRRYPEALDCLSEILLRGQILRPLPTAEVAREKACQEGWNRALPLSETFQNEKTF